MVDVKRDLEDKMYKKLDNEEVTTLRKRVHSLEEQCKYLNTIKFELNCLKKRIGRIELLTY